MVPFRPETHFVAPKMFIHRRLPVTSEICGDRLVSLRTQSLADLTISDVDNSQSDGTPNRGDGDSANSRNTNTASNNHAHHDDMGERNDGSQSLDNADSAVTTTSGVDPSRLATLNRGLVALESIWAALKAVAWGLWKAVWGIWKAVWWILKAIWWIVKDSEDLWSILKNRTRNHAFDQCEGVLKETLGLRDRSDDMMDVQPPPARPAKLFPSDNKVSWLLLLQSLYELA